MKVFRILVILVVLVIFGCQRGDFKASIVIEGQAAPHAGYNVGPDLYVEQGDPVPVSGAVIWIKNLDPNSLLKNE